MHVDSQIGYSVGKRLRSLQISGILILLIVVLSAICDAAQLFPAEPPVLRDKNIDEACCATCPAKNPEVKSEDNPLIGFRNFKA
jgi:hypothetical protein